MSDPDDPPAQPPADLAKVRGRLLVMQLFRLGGMAIAWAGIAGWTGHLAMPRAAAAVLLAIGLFEMLAMPVLLARRWRSPSQ